MHENENLFPTEPTLKILIVKTQLLFNEPYLGWLREYFISEIPA